jgi:hypothetical protein
VKNERIGRITALFSVLLAALLLPLAGAPPSAAQNIHIKIPPTNIPLTVKDRTVTITTFGTVTGTAQGRDGAALTVELDADLSELQQNLTPLLSEQLDKDSRCGDRIAIQNATLVPLPPASLATVQLHYERWGCAKLFGKEQTKRLVGGNATLQLKLTPSIEKEDTELHLTAELGEIQADGSLGELLRSGALGQTLREKIHDAILNALQKGSCANLALPPAIQAYASLQSVEFRDAGGGRLLAILSGNARVTQDQLQRLLKQVKERAGSGATH